MPNRGRRFRWDRRRPTYKRPPEVLRPERSSHPRPEASTSYNQVRRLRWRRWVLVPFVPAAARSIRRLIAGHTVSAVLAGLVLLGAGTAAVTAGTSHARSGHRPTSSSTTARARTPERTAGPPESATAAEQSTAAPTTAVVPVPTTPPSGPGATTPTLTIPAVTVPSATLPPVSAVPTLPAVTLPPVTLPAVTLPLP